MITDLRRLKPDISMLRTLRGRWREHPLYDRCIGHWLFNEGAGPNVYDVSKSGITGTLTSSQPTRVVYAGGRALSFSGTDQSIGMADNPLDVGTDDFTLSFWLVMDSTQVSSTATVFHKGAFNNSTPGYWAYFSSSGELTLQVGNGTTRSFHRLEGTDFRDDAVHHISIVVERTVGVTYYADGVSVGSDSSSVTGSADSTYTLDVGARNLGTPDLEFTGIIDEPMIHLRLLQSTEIESYFNDRFQAFRWAYEQRKRRYFYLAAAPPAGPHVGSLSLVGAGR